MTDIYAFGPDWALPAAVQDNVRQVVQDWLTSHPSDAAPWWKPALTSTSVLDTLTVPGAYPVDLSGTAQKLGIPVPADDIGFLVVGYGYNSAYTLQEYVSVKYPGSRWIRASWVRTWSEWQRGGSSGGSAVKPFKAGVSADNLLEQGDWVPISGVNAVSVGIPAASSSGVDALGRLEVRGFYSTSDGSGINSQYVRQTWIPLLDKHPRLTRQKAAGISGGVWSSWTETTAGQTAPAPLTVYVNTTTDGTDAALQHAMLVEDFTRRTGPVHTKGKGFVALRFDHGLTNFKSTVLPLLRARGFSATVAMNSRNWSIAENSGATPAEADGWDDIEFANHSATHEDAATTTALVDEIVNGHHELQSQLPNHHIDGWLIPGTTGSRYKGWGNGVDVRQFSDTEAGRLILSTHAWSSGHLPDTAQRPLDGCVRQGEAHFGIETRSFTEIKAEIDKAAADGTGLCLMMHPRVLNTTGYISTAGLTEILDYLKTQVTGGKLMVGTYSQLLVANKYLWSQKNTPATDSGWRALTPTAADGLVTAGTISIRRIGNTVWLNFTDVQLSSRSVWQRILVLPPGYRPDVNTFLLQPTSTASTGNDKISVYPTGPLHLTGHTDASDAMSFQVSYPTSEAFPS